MFVCILISSNKLKNILSDYFLKSGMLVRPCTSSRADVKPALLHLTLLRTKREKGWSGGSARNRVYLFWYRIA